MTHTRQLHLEVPLRRLALIVNGGTPSPNEEYWDGDVEWATPVDLARVDGGNLGSTDRTLTTAGLAEGSRVVPGGSLVLSTRAPIGYVAMVNQPTAFNQGCRGLVPGDRIDSRFLQLTLMAHKPLLESLGTGSTFKELSTEALGGVPIPLPAVEEQRRIADFLDDQVGRIDAALESARRQQRLLQEALISRLDDLTSNSESARERLRSLVRERDVRAGEEADPDHLLAVSIHHGVVPRRDITGDEARADSLANYKTVHVDDLVLNRMRAFQGGVGRADVEGICSPDYAVIQPMARVSGTYLHYVFRAHWFVAEMASRLRGIGSTDQGTVRTPRINMEDLLDIRIPVPEEGVQQRIVERCGQVEAITKERMVTLTRLTDLLEERKRALITAAVTGEMDVTTARPISMGRWVPGVGADVPPPAPTATPSLGGI